MVSVGTEALADLRSADRRPARPARPTLVSVVVPALNQERYVGEQLAALSRQTYAGAWEVVLVDNGSTDGTVEVARGWAHRLPSLRIVDASSRRGLGHARNMGALAAEGDLIAFCDADDEVTPGWLAALASAARSADVVGGTFDFEALNNGLLRAWRPEGRVSELLVAHAFLPYAPGGNCAVWASVAGDVGWNEAFAFGCSDQDFSWRAQLASYRLAFAPDAVVRLRFRGRLSELVRQWYRYGRAAPLLYRSFRHLGMRPQVSDALAAWRWLARHWRDPLLSPARRGNWLRIASLRLGRLVGSAHFRVLYP